MAGAYVDEMQGYLTVEGPATFPGVTEAELKAKLNSEQVAILRQQATVLACLAGNSFEGLIDQYMVDAYNVQWRNGHLQSDRSSDPSLLPNLYPSTAFQDSDAWMRQCYIREGLDPEDPQTKWTYWKLIQDRERAPVEAASGLAWIDKDGNPSEYFIMADEPSVHIFMGEVRKLQKETEEAFCSYKVDNQNQS